MVMCVCECIVRVCARMRPCLLGGRGGGGEQQAAG